MPSLLSTTSEPELFEQLIDRGWAAYGAESGPGEPSTSRLYITHQSLQLVVEGQILLDDLDPTAPPGWWRAVDSFDGRWSSSAARMSICMTRTRVRHCSD